MKKFIIVLIGIILAVGSFIGFFSLFNNTDDSNIYQGIVTFDNQEDFGAFKHEIAEKAIDIYNLDELNTSYPILISFSVQVEDGTMFNYGTLRDYTSIGLNIFLAILVTAGIMVLYLSIILFSDLWD